MRSSSPLSQGARPLLGSTALKGHPPVLQHAYSQPQVVGASTFDVAEPEEVSPDSVVSHLDLPAAVAPAGVLAAPLEESSEGEGQPSPWQPSGADAGGSAFAGSGLSGCLNFRARSRKQPASVKGRVKPRLGTLVSAGPSLLLHPLQHRCHPLHCAAARACLQKLQLTSTLQSRLGLSMCGCVQGRPTQIQLEVEPRPVSEVFKNMNPNQWRWFMQSFTEQTEALADSRWQQSCRQRLGASNVFGSAPVRF